MTTKLFTSLTLSLGCLASLVIACGSAVDPTLDDLSPNEPSSDEAEVGKKKKASCASVGGQCVGLSPSACPGGTWADAKEVTCGRSTGVGCCIANTCPSIVAPAPSFCPGGTIKPQTDCFGCTTGYECVPGAKNACEAAGGQCVGLAPSSCPSANWGDGNKYSCGTGVGVGCCLP